MLRGLHVRHSRGRARACNQELSRTDCHARVQLCTQRSCPTSALHVRTDALDVRSGGGGRNLRAMLTLYSPSLVW
jgi:hypothetical protein